MYNEGDLVVCGNGNSKLIGIIVKDYGYGNDNWKGLYDVMSNAGIVHVHKRSLKKIQENK